MRLAVREVESHGSLYLVAVVASEDETRDIKYSRFRRWRQPRLSHLALHRFPTPLAASHLADLATPRVEHPPLFRLSACSACRDTRIEFVKDPVSAYLCFFLALPILSCVSVSLSVSPGAASDSRPTSPGVPGIPRNKAAVDVVHSSGR